MVVTLTAPAIEVLAAGRAHDVDLAGVGQPLQGAVDGGQADPFAPLAQHGVQILGAVEAGRLGEHRAHRGALFGVAQNVVHGLASLA
jgi:hypothetical protein